MKFIKNNRELIVLVVIVSSMLGMAVGIGIGFRGGNPPVYWGK